MTLTQTEIDQLLTAGFSWDKIKTTERMIQIVLKRLGVSQTKETP